MIRTARFALSTLILTAAVLLASPPSPATAAFATYALAVSPESDHFGDLYTIDLGTAATTRIGSTGRWLGGLAIAPDGTLYATGDFNTLYRLDASTGAATPIGETPCLGLAWADFNGDRLLATDLRTDSTTVYSIDTATAATTLVATTSPPRGSPRGLAVAGPGSAFLVTSTTGGFPQDARPTTLSVIDLATGATTDIGVIAGHHFVQGIDTDEAGTLYGLDDLGSLFTIDTTSGATTLIGDTRVRDWIDLAIDPPADMTVPEPGAWGLLVVGLVGIGTWGRVRLARP